MLLDHFRKSIETAISSLETAGHSAPARAEGGEASIAGRNLNGFDMVYALTEQTINNQFKLLWATGVLPTSWKASTKHSSIDSQLGAPSISFNTGDASARQVNLVLPLTQGSIKYFNLDQMAYVTTDISGSTLQLTINLSLAEIAATYKDAAHVPAEVKQQLSHFDDSMFSIQHLFMDLEDANLLKTWDFQTGGRLDMTEATVVTQVEDLIKAYIYGLKQSGNPYILGYSVTDKKAGGTDATWKPTGVTFSVYPDAAYPRRNSLNYLLETCNKPVPGNAGIFNHNWVTKDDVQGAFVFAPDLVLDQVVEALTRVLPVTKDSFQLKGNSITATFDNDVHGTTTVTVSPVAGNNTIETTFYVYFRKEVYDHANSHIGYVDGWIHWTSTMAFTVDSKDGTIKVSVTNSDPGTEKTDHPNTLGKLEEGLAIFADFVLNIMTFGSINDLFEKMVAADWRTSISTKMGPVFQEVRTRIILPAGSELLFKDCSFLADGTMSLTTTIKD